jgi:hypothetical protein
MNEGLCELRETNCTGREKRPHDYGMANAIARKVRRDWPAGTIDATAAEYRLTNGEARGVVYGTASRATIDKVLKRGGWALAVELVADVLGQPLEHFIEEQAKRARHERTKWEAEERAAKARLARLAEYRERDRFGP